MFKIEIATKKSDSLFYPSTNSPFGKRALMQVYLYISISRNEKKERIEGNRSDQTFVHSLVFTNKKCIQYKYRISFY